MTQHETNRRVGVQLDVGRSAAAARAEPVRGGRFRIVICGNFSGRGATAADLAGARLHAVDRDRYDALLEFLSPRITVRPNGGEPVEVPIADLDDFHPDTLYQRLPWLEPVRELRARLSDPRTFRKAAQELLGEWPPPEPDAEERRVARPRQVGGGLLEDIVAATTGSPGAPPPPVEDDELGRFIRQALAGHVVPGEDPRQEALLAQVDSLIGGRLRAILHDPAFQDVESLWRALLLVVRRLETGPRLTVSLLDASREALAADLAPGRPVERTALHRLLADAAGEDVAATLLVACYTFGAASDDLGLLARMAGLARRLRAVCVTGAAPPLAGWSSFERPPEAGDWMPPADAEWTALRRSEDARHLGLVAPRLLVRLPYGAGSDPCDVVPFEELGSPPAHDRFLWGNPALLCALILGRAVTGEDAAGGRRTEVSGLPLHLIREAGEVTAKSCAETLLSERAAAAMLAAGVMPLVWVRDRDTVRLLRVQSVAEPPAPLAFDWPSPPVETT